MKHWPVKETKQRQNNVMMTSYGEEVTSLLIFQFMADLGQFGSQILNLWSVKHVFINSNLISNKNGKQN